MFSKDHDFMSQTIADVFNLKSVCDKNTNKIKKIRSKTHTGKHLLMNIVMSYSIVGLCCDIRGIIYVSVFIYFHFYISTITNIFTEPNEQKTEGIPASFETKNKLNKGTNIFN